MLRFLTILAALLVFPNYAFAEPISIFLAVTSAGATFGAGVVAAIGSITFAGVAAFLMSPFGSLILGIGLQLITALFVKKPQAPSIEAASVNVRISEPERWLNAGINRVGGGVIFAEFDSEGNFWYVLAHSDSILGSVEKKYFDNIEITTDVDGFVETDEFCLTDGGEIYSGTGAKVNYYQIFTRTPTLLNPVAPAIEALKTAFPGVWTDDHKLTGVTYTAVKIKPISPENRYKVLKWRGSVGIGEPSFSVVGRWNKIFDPRDITQTINNKNTYKFSRNPALLWAWFRTHPYGRNKSVESINWNRIAEQANICDLNKSDIDGGFAPQYQCDISIPESTERNIGEQQILMSCDAQLVFDDDGKCWPRVGYFYQTNLHLYRNRDIVAMESVEAQNGESLTHGVIVRYIDPDADYSTQPCAPYVNPFYYVEGETPKYLVVDILTIQNHRQAMQLAKSISKRSQPEEKLMPTTGLRGLRANQERIIDLQYDNTFSGDYEIVTPTEVESNGAFIGFGCVPINADRWNFLPGEEKPKPVNADSQSLQTPALPSGVVVEFKNNRIEISYNPSQRQDWFYEFQQQIKPIGGTTPDANRWINMQVQTKDDYAFSGSVVQNADYWLRWRGKSTGGAGSAWLDPVQVVNTSTLVLTGTPVTSGVVGTPYVGFDIDVTGGQSPYFFADTFGRLPDGLAINSASGIVSGTPTVTGIFANIAIRAQDNIGNFKNFPEFTIEIEAI